jgi:hypothetical protein
MSSFMHLWIQQSAEAFKISNSNNTLFQSFLGSLGHPVYREIYEQNLYLIKSTRLLVS